MKDSGVGVGTLQGAPPIPGGEGEIDRRPGTAFRLRPLRKPVWNLHP
jgi:hypothetical protein